MEEYILNNLKRLVGIPIEEIPKTIITNHTEIEGEIE
jgi:hypothetical protein